MNDSHNYLGSTNWWSQGRLTATGASLIKTVPPPTVTTPIVTAQVADAGGTTTTLVDAARTEAQDFWKNKLLRITSGANNTLIRTITGFNLGTNTIAFAPAVPAAIGAGITYEIFESAVIWRLVVTGYNVSGVNTNAALTDIIFRHTVNTANVILDAFIPPVSGGLAMPCGRCWIPMEENESLEMLVSGALTGVAAYTFWGRVFPSTTPLAMVYLGNATNPV